VEYLSIEPRNIIFSLLDTISPSSNFGDPQNARLLALTETTYAPNYIIDSEQNLAFWSLRNAKNKKAAY
jgi:hypothetical protein